MGTEEQGGWSRKSLLRFSHTRLKQTGRRGVGLLKLKLSLAEHGGTPGADKQAGDNPTEFSLSCRAPLPVCLNWEASLRGRSA